MKPRMSENYRRFTAGPDPFGRMWEVQFLWLQTGIAIRHADTVDVKFKLWTGQEEPMVKVIALPHPELLELSRKHNRPLTDPWCLRLGALHVREMISTFEDMEKTVVTVPPEALERHHGALASVPAWR